MKSLINFSLLLLSGLCIFGATPSPTRADVLDPDVVVDSNSYTLVSSRRVTRTAMEYTLRALANNTSSTQYTNVIATLVSVPPNIAIVDGTVNFGTVSANSSATSTDEFIIRVDLRVATSFADLVWRVEGDPPPLPPPGPGPAPGKASQVGYFMSIDDNGEIKGESKSETHKDWIELLAYNEGSSRSGAISTGEKTSTGKLNLNDVGVLKYIDASSAPLRLAVAQGDIFGEIKIDIIQSCGGNPYVRYAVTLTRAMITSVSAGGSGGEDRLTEGLTINFARIETMYTPVDGNCQLQTPLYSFQDAVTQ